jgi:hypothetical protein
MASLDSDDDGARQRQLPLMLGVALLLVAGSRFAPAFTASVFAFGFPLLAVTLAFAPLRDSIAALRHAAFALAGVALLAGELRISAAFELAPPAAAARDSSGSVWLLVAAAAAAVAPVAAARRGMRTFAGAWVEYDRGARDPSARPLRAGEGALRSGDRRAALSRWWPAADRACSLEP